MKKTQKKRNDDLSKQATDAFRQHVIRKRSEDRVLLQRPDTGIFWLDIILLGNGLYVGGDIKPVVFGGGQDAIGIEQRVSWMNRSSADDHYFIEKACIGTGRESIMVYDADAAVEDVENLIRELDAEGARKSLIQELREIAEQRPEYHYELLDLLFKADDGSIADIIMEQDFGMVIEPRLFFAWAALRRLCTLLGLDDQEKS